MQSLRIVLSFFAIVFLTIACNSASKEGSKVEVTKSVADSISKAKHIKRFGMVTGIKADKIAYYKQLHANAWPEVQRMITECNIHNYSIFLKQIDGKYYLFGYFEYTGNDFDSDMKKMAADSITQRWWQQTDPMQIPLPEASAKKEIWSDMQEVFHKD